MLFLVKSKSTVGTLTALPQRLQNNFTKTFFIFKSFSYRFAGVLCISPAT